MDSEVWYELEASRKGADDWASAGTTNSADSLNGIMENLVNHERMFSSSFDFRAVKVTTTREVVCS